MKTRIMCALFMSAVVAFANVASAHFYISVGLLAGGSTWPQPLASPNFPDRLATDLISTGTLESLNSQGIELYVASISFSGGSVNYLTTPIRVDQYFQQNGFDVWGEIQSALVVDEVRFNPSLGASDRRYQPCPTGVGLDAPTAAMQTPISTDGKLTIQDLNFGGVGENTTIFMSACVNGTHSCEFKYFFTVSWQPPGRYTDAHTGNPVNCKPGQVVFQSVETSYNHLGSNYPISIMTPIHTVEWVSTDVTRDGFVDAGDLAAFTTGYNQAVRWGFPGESGAPTYKLNFVPFGTLGSGDTSERVDSQDLAALAGDLGQDACGGAGKASADARDERADILTWFGVTPTGGMIDVNGERVPEYTVSDAAKMARAALDPYGYRAGIERTEGVRWGYVKRLYR